MVCDPTNLDFEQVQNYLLYLKESATPSQRYFKHCIYNFRFNFDRLQVHIRNSKYGKNRYVVMSQILKKGLILTWHLNNYIFFRSETVKQFKNGLPAFRSNAAPTHKGKRFKQHNHYNRG